MGNKCTPEIRFVEFTEDWEKHDLGELSESFEYGLNVSATEYDGRNKYIRITDIDDNTHKFLENNLTSPNVDLLSADNYLLREGDILFARTGASVGKTYIYDNKDGIVYYAGFLIRARIKSRFSARFIFQYTLTTKYNEFIKVTSQRSGQPGVNAQEYSKFEIMVPHIEEQTRIGNFFKQLDDIITLNEQELTTLKQTKQGFLQKMFPKEGESVPEIRFPGFTGDWEQRKLGEVIKIVGGATPSKANKAYWGGDIVWLSSQEIKNRYVSAGTYTITEKAVRESATKVVPAFTPLIVSRSGILARMFPITLPTIDVAINQDIKALFFDRKILDTDFFVSQLEMKENTILTSIVKTGTTVQSVNMPDFERLMISIPSIHEQQTIGKTFKNLDNLIALHQRELNALKETKKAFLQKMFV